MPPHRFLGMYTDAEYRVVWRASFAATWPPRKSFICSEYLAAFHARVWESINNSLSAPLLPPPPRVSQPPGFWKGYLGGHRVVEVDHIAADSGQGEQMFRIIGKRVRYIAVGTSLRPSVTLKQANSSSLACHLRPPLERKYFFFSTAPHVQGVLSAQDAVLAVQAGASGVIVSNHGGRALDGSLSSIESLGSVVKVKCVFSTG